MNSTIKEKMYIAAKSFAKSAIIKPHNHPETVEDFEAGFIKGAEWLFENFDQLKKKGLIGFADAVDAAIEKHAESLFKRCDTSTFNEEEKKNLYNSFKYPYEEGIDWAYDNYEE